MGEFNKVIITGSEKKWSSHGTFAMLYNFIGLNVIPWDVQLIWRDVIGSTGNDVYASPLHVFSTLYSSQSMSLRCFVGVSS